MSDVSPARDVDWAAAYQYLEEQYELTTRRLAERLEAYEARLAEHTKGAIRAVTLEVGPDGYLTSVVMADGRSLSYAFYVYRDDQLVVTEPYGASNTLRRRVKGGGAYRVRGFVRTDGAQEHADTAASPVVRVGGKVRR